MISVVYKFREHNPEDIKDHDGKLELWGMKKLINYDKNTMGQHSPISILNLKATMVNK